MTTRYIKWFIKWELKHNPKMILMRGNNAEENIGNKILQS